MRRSMLLTLLVLGTLPTTGVSAQEGTAITPVSGEVSFRVAATDPFESLDSTRVVAQRGEVRTGGDGYALLRHPDGSETVVRPGSTVLIEGGEGEGLRVLLGKVLLRVRRLFRPGQERTYRTPTTVAAVRGTEFGLAVEESGRTRVYVFAGRVAVSNPERPDSLVELEVGYMSEVEAGRAPTAPRLFSAGEFDAIGDVDAPERGEDRLVEATQAAVSFRYLAWRDDDLDALANPAYLMAGSSSRLSSVVVARGLTGRSSVVEDGTTTFTEDEQGGTLLSQNFGVATLGAMRLGVFGAGEATYDRGVHDVRVPGGTAVERLVQRTDLRRGEGRILLAGGDERSWGVSAGVHRSDTDTEDRSPTGVTESVKASGSASLVTLSAGVRTEREGVVRGLGYRFGSGSQDVDSEGRAETFDNRTHTLEFLLRRTKAKLSLGALISAERSTVDESVDQDGARLYTEELALWGGRIGFGLGVRPVDGLALTVDAGLGVVDERAKQIRPDGSILEDEGDTRVSGSLHGAAQVVLGGPWRMDLSLFIAGERIARDFQIDPGGAGASTVVDTRATYRTLGRLGLLRVGRTWTGGYTLGAAADPGRPPVHTLFVAGRLF